MEHSAKLSYVGDLSWLVVGDNCNPRPDSWEKVSVYSCSPETADHCVACTLAGECTAWRGGQC